MSPTLSDLENKAAPNTPYFTPAQDPPAGTAFDPQPDGKPIPKLFQPLKIRGLTLQNRVMLAPLCQYSSEDGHATMWQKTHIGGIAQRGPGLTTIEATAVMEEGRITPQDAGLWKDSQMAPLKEIVDFAHSQGQKIMIQLAHAGRKASTVAPWISLGDTAPAELGGWPDNVYGPSTIAYNERFPTPKAATKEYIEAFKAAYAAAVKRAIAVGFDAIEIHSAHGYLLHEFLSPVTNNRTDEYGGSFENRTRLVLETVDLCREIMPKDMPLFIRISATDGLEKPLPDVESWRLEDSVRLAPLLAERGVDAIDVSSGGMDRRQFIQPGPGYQVPFANAIKAAVGDKLLVGTVGMITEGKQANSYLEDGLDLAIIGRAFQKNPGIVWTFADDLGVATRWANQIRWGFGGRGK